MQIIEISLETSGEIFSLDLKKLIIIYAVAVIEWGKTIIVINATSLNAKTPEEMPYESFIIIKDEFCCKELKLRKDEKNPVTVKLLRIYGLISL